LEEVSSIIVTHQLRDAFYIATHEAARKDGTLDFVATSPDKAAEIAFIMLKDGLIHYEGQANELRKSNDPYLRSFLS
jgi:phospholipid/cholesterol/gamma-HCH transport system ATP-binding protein